MKKVLIIGTGIGALSAGMRLAKNKYEVHFFEMRDKPGGKCETVEIGNFSFDRGPSLLTLPAVFRDLFLATGKRLELMAELKPVEPAFDYYFADGTHLQFPNLSLNGILAEIESKLGKKESQEFAQLIAQGEKIWDISRTPFIENELDATWKYFVNPAIIKNIYTIKPWKTLRGIVNAKTESNHLRCILERYATYSGSDPRKAPGVLLSIPFMEITFGAWQIKGGLGKLGELAKERAEALGAKFNFQCKVEEILIEYNKAIGIKVNGENIFGDYVISGADAQITYNQLIPSKVKVGKERSRLKKSELSFSGFSLFLGLKNSSKNFPKLNHHTVFFPKDYNQEFVELFDQKKPINDPTIYIHCVNSGQEYESWSILINAPIHDPKAGCDWDKLKKNYQDLILNKLEGLGLRVKERLQYLEVRTPADLERDYGAPGGSIYGQSMNHPLATFNRARNRSSVEKLFCTSGSTHPGGGLPLVGLSGEMVANSIIKSGT